MIKELLEEKKLPPILQMNDGRTCDTPELWAERRKEILDLFSREVYGYMPEAPENVRFFEKEHREGIVAGLGSYSRMIAAFETPKGPYQFEFDFYMPYTDKKVPVVVYLQFSLNCQVTEFPVESIIRNGFAVAQIHNGDVMRDVHDYSQGLGSMYVFEPSPWDDLDADAYAANRKRGQTQSGMLGYWAFAASRVVDYLETLPQIDMKRVAVGGHSRLGKTALWAAANDERFTLAMISASGNSGASLHKFKTDENEHIAQIASVFPYWFSKNYPSYAGHEDEMPFDQHMILATIAPRSFYICSGSEDTWAGPNTEYLCGIAASEPYKLFGKKGLVHPDRMPEAGDIFDEGDAGYSMHEGGHYLGNFEWNNIMNFMKKM